MEFGDTADWKSALRICLLDPVKTEALRLCSCSACAVACKNNSMNGGKKFRLGVLGSGKGSNMVAIADAASGGTSFLNTIDAMTPTDAVSFALRQLGVDRIAAGSPTHTALVNLVIAERAANTAANQRRNLARTIAISPEYSLA